MEEVLKMDEKAIVVPKKICSNFSIKKLYKDFYVGEFMNIEFTVFLQTRYDIQTNIFYFEMNFIICHLNCFTIMSNSHHFIPELIIYNILFDMYFGDKLTRIKWNKIRRGSFEKFYRRK